MDQGPKDQNNKLIVSILTKVNWSETRRLAYIEK